jgi:hypothetical protein
MMPAKIVLPLLLLACCLAFGTEAFNPPGRLQTSGSLPLGYMSVWRELPGKQCSGKPVYQTPPGKTCGDGTGPCTMLKSAAQSDQAGQWVISPQSEILEDCGCGSDCSVPDLRSGASCSLPTGAACAGKWMKADDNDHYYEVPLFTVTTTLTGGLLRTGGTMSRGYISDSWEVHRSGKACSGQPVYQMPLGTTCGDGSGPCTMLRASTGRHSGQWLISPQSEILEDCGCGSDCSVPDLRSGASCSLPTGAACAGKWMQAGRSSGPYRKAPLFKVTAAQPTCASGYPAGRYSTICTAGYDGDPCTVFCVNESTASGIHEYKCSSKGSWVGGTLQCTKANPPPPPPDTHCGATPPIQNACPCSAGIPNPATQCLARCVPGYVLLKPPTAPALQPQYSCGPQGRWVYGAAKCQRSCSFPANSSGRDSGSAGPGPLCTNSSDGTPHAETCIATPGLPFDTCVCRYPWWGPNGLCPYHVDDRECGLDCPDTDTRVNRTCAWRLGQRRFGLSQNDYESFCSVGVARPDATPPSQQRIDSPPWRWVLVTAGISLAAVAMLAAVVCRRKRTGATDANVCFWLTIGSYIAFAATLTAALLAESLLLRRIKDSVDARFEVWDAVCVLVTIGTLLCVPRIITGFKRQASEVVDCSARATARLALSQDASGWGECAV